MLYSMYGKCKEIMEYKYLKIVVYVPVTQADKIRQVLAEAGAGHIPLTSGQAGQVGKYDSCSFSVKGVGRFRPLEGAKPAIGEVGQIEEVEEERIETVVAAEKLEEVLTAVKAAHPYEEPAIDVYPLLNL